MEEGFSGSCSSQEKVVGQDLDLVSLTGPILLWFAAALPDPLRTSYLNKSFNVVFGLTFQLN